jgi:hypothetical protein
LLLSLGGNLPPLGEREQTLQLSINNCLLRFRKLLTGNTEERARRDAQGRLLRGGMFAPHHLQLALLVIVNIAVVAFLAFAFLIR